MTKSRNFTKKQLHTINSSMENIVNSWEPDIIDRCSEKNIKEIHNILEEHLRGRIELKSAADAAIGVLKEVEKEEKARTVAEDFDKVEIDDSLFVGSVAPKKETVKEEKVVVKEEATDKKMESDKKAVVKEEATDKKVEKKAPVKKKDKKEAEPEKTETEEAKKPTKKTAKKATPAKEVAKETEKEAVKEKDIVEGAPKKKTSKVKKEVEEPKAEVKSIREEVKDVRIGEKLSDSLDIAISFDTTGSMYSVLATVRRDVKNTVRELFDQFGPKKLRISIIAHGDYCDKNHPYTIKVLNFTNNVDEICDFVTNVESTYGGDSDECYELVLNTVRTALEWNADSEKILMMIGDCNPHPVGYKCREMSEKNEIDWHNEADLLSKMGVRIYGVHALHHYRNYSKPFYETISKVTKGTYLTLDNFSDVLQIISATCYRNHSEKSYNDFITVIKENKIGGRTLWDNIRRLNGEIVDDDASDYYSRSSKRKSSSKDLVFKTLPGLNPVPAGRFQVIDVLENCSIKGFVESNGIKYKVGRAFYELTKTEDVQQYKEIILQDKESGDMYYGDEARKHLKLLPQCTRSGSYGHEKIKPDKNDPYRVFVQSTSVNRKLIGKTKLLYEISEI